MIPITAYEELHNFVVAFGQGHLNMMVLWSKGGYGKSEEVRRCLDGPGVIMIGGHVTPLKLYELLHEGRDKQVVFDEIDGLLSDRKHVGLLKQVCETRENKKIMWTSPDQRAAAIDGGRGYFYTRSHVLILCNSFATLNANVAALKTRGMVVEFRPPTTEILGKIKTFARDKEILAFLERFHECVQEFSLRTYGMLEDLKKAGLDWKRYALDECDIPSKVVEIADLLTSFDNDGDRVKHYSGSRRDYYYWKAEASSHARRRALTTLHADLGRTSPV